MKKYLFYFWKTISYILRKQISYRYFAKCTCGRYRIYKTEVNKKMKLYHGTIHYCPDCKINQK